MPVPFLAAFYFLSDEWGPHLPPASGPSPCTGGLSGPGQFPQWRHHSPARLWMVHLAWTASHPPHTLPRGDWFRVCRVHWLQKTWGEGARCLFTSRLHSS